jgi:hypothetical protein
MQTILRLNPERLIQRVTDLATQMPDRVADTQRQVIKERINHPIIPRLAETLIRRAADCQRILLL